MEMFSLMFGTKKSILIVTDKILSLFQIHRSQTLTYL